MTQTLTRFGYNLKLENWAGRLGNHLIQLSNAIHVASNTKSILTIPPHDTLKRRHYDFRENNIENCNESVSSYFFWPRECFNFPIKHDYVRRCILKNHIASEFQNARTWKPFSLLKHNYITKDTLIINIRSGSDIFRTDPPPQSDYMQPPLSFYQDIIERHNYKRCVIVTESDRLNPVIDRLLGWNNSIQLNLHRNVDDDIRLVLAAQHLVTAHSTFSWCLALMSPNLKVLHQPSSFQISGVPDFNINTYHIENYIPPGSWNGSPQQMELMIKHSRSYITHQAEDPTSYLPLSHMGNTNELIQHNNTKNEAEDSA